MSGGSEHYFRPRPGLGHETVRFTVAVRGVALEVETDRGVFSRRGLDAGTRLLLETVPFRPGQRVLDLGAGWGAVGLVAAVLVRPGEVVLTDVNERAVALARRNARRNRLDNVTVLVSDGFSALGQEKFHLILTNPPIRAGKAVYYPWLEEGRRHLLPEGSLWVVVRRHQGARSLAEHLGGRYRQVTLAARRGDYVVLEVRGALEDGL